jgi:hypothetical protein
MEIANLPPQDEIENSAPQRVQTTVSPPRVASQDSNQTSRQHIITSQLTPNSHRRQHTPLRRIITPHTPHVMVQRSARQHNVSQGMMAETITQANHRFSISSQTKYTHQSSTQILTLSFYRKWHMQSSALKLVNLPSTKNSSPS